MTAAALFAPFLVAVVLLVSGVAKLRDAAGVDAAFRALRVPAALNQRWLRRAFPWGEIALGVLLVAAPSPANVLAAIAALMLMGAYLALVVAAVRRPDPVDCHCFGALTEGRVSGLTVVRNALLALAAAVALADSVAGTPLLRLDAASVGWLLAATFTAALAVTIVGDRRDEAPAEAMPAAPEGTDAEDLDYVRLPIPYGALVEGDKDVTLRQLARQRAVLLLWVSTTCGSCSEVIAQIPAWQAALAPVEVRPVLSSLDGLEERAPTLASSALGDPDSRVARLFDTWGVPMGILLGVDGRLAGGPVVGARAITELVDQMREQLAEVAEPEPVDAPSGADADAVATVPEGVVAPR